MPKEFLVEGAPCLCKFGAAPGKLKVTDNTFFKMNGSKLSATTLTLGNVFDPPGFGVCKVNPMAPIPCAPAITQWSGQFQGLKTSKGGYPLTDASKATCACGCPDCVEFMMTGQIPIPGPKQMREATAEHQGELDPAGSPAALTEHQIAFNLEIKPDTLKNVLVRVVKGPKTAMPAQEVEYHVERYNIDHPSAEVATQVQWKVEVDGKEVKVEQPKGETLKLKISTDWQGKEVVAMAYIKAPKKTVCQQTRIKQWQFPIVIDRYKMPGLNGDGTDIAGDMAYGYGTPYLLPIYDSASLNLYLKQYTKDGFNPRIHSVYSNAEDLPTIIPFTHILKQSELTLEEKAENYSRNQNRKAIYSAKDIPDMAQKLIDIVRFIRKGSEQFSDEELFHDFEVMARGYFSLFDSDMGANIMQMIAKFKRKEGGIFESETLTNNIKKHPSTEIYCGELDQYISRELNKAQGDIDKLNDKKTYFKIAEEFQTERGKKTFSLTPSYPAPSLNDLKEGRVWERIKNTIQGRTIALNDIWATEVLVTQYEITGNSYKLTYQVTLWDHFGLDSPDIGDQKFARLGAGFRAWFILQHFRGYRPFVTKITFERKLTGKLTK